MGITCKTKTPIKTSNTSQMTGAIIQLLNIVTRVPSVNLRPKFALDHEAVQQLRNKEKNLPQLQGLPDTGNLQDPGSSKSKASRQEDPTN
nr:unnamed protein product [Callosobruchus chinensis]